MQKVHRAVAPSYIPATDGQSHPHITDSNTLTQSSSRGATATVEIALIQTLVYMIGQSHPLWGSRTLRQSTTATKLVHKRLSHRQINNLGVAEL